MAGNKNSVVPQEYVDKMLEFDIEAWRQQKIADALKNLAERDEVIGGDAPPEWWKPQGNVPMYDENGEIYGHRYSYDSDVYGHWQNCISTATSPYGEQCRVIGNKSFINPNDKNYFINKGFRLLQDGEELNHGDLVQVFRPDANGGYEPIHMLTYTGDKDGERLYSYGSGIDTYYQRNGRYPIYDGYKTQNYRFVGTPSDIAEIEAHNAKVREFNDKTAPLREGVKVTPLKIEEEQDKNNIDKVANQTAEWLSKIAKYGKRK